jgi:aminoglycoside phosphotransferase (APT) family kinase protein
VPDWLRAHSAEEWLEYFSRRGYREVKELAAGVEGTVYDLGAEQVAKVWRQRRAAELVLMQAFYADVARAGLPFGTPEIHSVEQVGPTVVTFERKLPGQPLQHQLGSEDRQANPLAVRCLIEALRALASVPASASMRRLPVLDEDQAFWTGAPDFPAALAGLLRRRTARFGAVIRRELPDFEVRGARVLERLAAVERVQDTVVHGDLFAGNVLVDDRLRPTAVLDFGFLTTAGDPRLDAAITAATINMYGPHALADIPALTSQVAEELGYPAETLLIYQAAFAVATSNAFTADGSDGHFAWCVAQLTRPDIMAALSL